MAQPFTVIVPTSITPDMLVASSVPEDETAWVSGGAYSLGDQRASARMIYQCIVAVSGSTTPPESDPTHWAPVRPTNRWRCLDTSNSTKTARSGGFSYTLRPGIATTAAALLGVSGATAGRLRVIDATYGTAYDQTTELAGLPRRADPWEWYFGRRRYPGRMLALDLPSLPFADLQIDLTGGADCALGTLVIGQAIQFGVGVKYGASSGIKDYSDYEENVWGDMAITPGKHADIVEMDLVIDSDEVDEVKDILTDLRYTPCVCVGYQGYKSLTVFGLIRSFRVVIAGPVVSECAVQIQSMT